MALDDPDKVIGKYLTETNPSMETASTESLSLPLSESLPTPTITDMTRVNIKIIDFGVCMFSFVTHRRKLPRGTVPQALYLIRTYTATFLLADHILLLASWIDRHLSDHLQPEHLRAPEVTLGAPWSTGVDIWSLGCLVRKFIIVLQTSVTNIMR